MAWWVRSIPTGWLSNYLREEKRGPFDSESEADNEISDILSSISCDTGDYEEDERAMDDARDLMEFEMWNDDDDDDD